MRHVNLLPPEYAARGWWAAEEGGPETTKRILLLTGAATALVAVVMMGMIIHQRSLINDRKETLAGLQQEAAEIAPAVAKARADQANAQAQLAAVHAVVAGRMEWEKSLRQLAQVLPSNALLTALQVQAPAGATGTPGAPAGFSVTGATSSQRAVANVLDRLALLPWLTEVTLGSSAPSDNSVQFAISSAVRSDGAR